MEVLLVGKSLGILCLEPVDDALVVFPFFVLFLHLFGLVVVSLIDKLFPLALIALLV